MARVFSALAGLWFFFALPCFAISQSVSAPAWNQLSNADQRVLAPVMSEWDRLPSIQRQRLLGVAKHYPKMSPLEQQRLQSRLKDWSGLSPQQRKIAREKYQKLKQLPPEKRLEVKQKWRKQQQGSNAATKGKSNPAIALPAPQPETSSNAVPNSAINPQKVP